MKECKCVYGGPLGMERSVANCPIHNSSFYLIIESYWFLEEMDKKIRDIQEAIELAEVKEITKSIRKARAHLSKFEKFVKETHKEENRK